MARLLDHEVRAAVAVVSLDGIVLFWNRRAETMFERSSDEATGRPLDQVVRVTGAVEHSRALRRAAESGFALLETYRLRSDGRRIPIAVSFDVVDDRRGRPKAILTVYRDRRAVPRTGRNTGAPIRDRDEPERRHLTVRQRQVLVLIAEGLSTHEIARRIGRSVKTVEAHRADMMHRLDINTLAGLIRFALGENTPQKA